jgi:hypothetical protein
MIDFDFMPVKYDSFEDFIYSIYGNNIVRYDKSWTETRFSLPDLLQNKVFAQHFNVINECLAVFIQHDSHEMKDRLIVVLLDGSEYALLNLELDISDGLHYHLDSTGDDSRIYLLSYKKSLVYVFTNEYFVAKSV